MDTFNKRIRQLYLCSWIGGTRGTLCPPYKHRCLIDDNLMVCQMINYSTKLVVSNSLAEASNFKD